MQVWCKKGSGPRDFEGSNVTSTMVLGGWGVRSAKGTMAAAMNGNTRRSEQVGDEGPVQKQMLMWERIPTQRNKSILYVVEGSWFAGWETWKGWCRGASHPTTVRTQQTQDIQLGKDMGLSLFFSFPTWVFPTWQIQCSAVWCLIVSWKLIFPVLYLGSRSFRQGAKNKAGKIQRRYLLTPLTNPSSLL